MRYCHNGNAENAVDFRVFLVYININKSVLRRSKTQEKKMTRLFEVFKTLRSKRAKASDLENWAKIEYGKDWAFAYNYMLSTGEIPRKGDY